MKTLVVGACGLLLVVGLSGCGSSADGLMKEQIKLMEEFADALEKGADTSKIEEIHKRMRENVMKLEGLQWSDDKKKTLGEKYAAELSKASKRFSAAVQKNMDKMSNLQLDTIIRISVQTGGSGK